MVPDVVAQIFFFKSKISLALRQGFFNNGVMAKVCTEHKKRLLAMGKWPEFVLFRDELKANGVKPAESNRLAVLKFLGEEAASHPGEDRICRKGVAAKPVVIPAAVGVDVPVEVSEDVGGPSPAVCAPAPKLDSTPAAFSPPSMAGEVPEDVSGREASGAEIVMWVVRNLDVQGVRAEDCPDPAAWTYLKQCRDSAIFRQNFMLQVGLKSLLRIEGEGIGEDVTGARLSETIDKLLSFQLRGNSAVEECRAHASVVAGSTPAPATISGGV